MVTMDADLAPEEAAALHEALAHPARVAAVRILREHGKRMPLSELRWRVADATGPLDTRGVQFHARKLQAAGILDVRKEEGRDVAVLLRDVSLKFRLVTGAGG